VDGTLVRCATGVIARASRAGSPRPTDATVTAALAVHCWAQYRRQCSGEWCETGARLSGVDASAEVAVPCLRWDATGALSAPSSCSCASRPIAEPVGHVDCGAPWATSASTANIAAVRRAITCQGPALNECIRSHHSPRSAGLASQRNPPSEVGDTFTGMPIQSKRIHSALGVGLAAGLLFAVTPAAAQQPSDSAQVAGVISSFHAALERGDSAAALALLSPSAVILESGSSESVAEYRAHHLPADIEFARALKSVRTPLRITVRGDWAWAAATSTTQGEFKGRAVNSTGAELLVLERGPSGWRIAAIHWSSRRRS
jgi:ketosteroid isomerase-like protein